MVLLVLERSFYDDSSSGFSCQARPSGSFQMGWSLIVFYWLFLFLPISAWPMLLLCHWLFVLSSPWLTGIWCGRMWLGRRLHYHLVLIQKEYEFIQCVFCYCVWIPACLGNVANLLGVTCNISPSMLWFLDLLVLWLRLTVGGMQLSDWSGCSGVSRVLGTCVLQIWGLCHFIRCRSPFKSSWVSTAPVATFNASDSIWNGFDWSGINSTSSSVNHCFKMSNTFWHSVVHSNFLSFFIRLFRGQARSE